MSNQRPNADSLTLTFEKGLQESQEDSMIPVGFAALLENWVPEPNGGLRCRRGWANGSTTGAPATRRAKGVGFFATAESTGAVSTKTGSFVANTSTGNQAVTGVGFTPKALMLYTAGHTAVGFASDMRMGYGFTTGATESWSIAAASDNGAADSNTSSRITNKALTIVDWGEVVNGECDLVTFDSDGFTVNWTDAPAGAYIVNYFAIGGDDVTHAKGVQWAAQAGTGNQSVTGVGFQPDLVMHIGINRAGTLGNEAPAGATGKGTVTFGAMDRSGNQWVNGFLAVDAAASSDTQQFQLTDHCVGHIDATLAFRSTAAFTSMDSDGFTVNWDVNAGQLPILASLCIKGPRIQVGNFAKSTGAAPASDTVTGVGFQPKALLLARALSGNTSTTPVADVSWTIGTSTGAAASKAISVRDRDAQATMDTQSAQSNKVLSRLNHNSASTVDYEADLTSFNSDGFTLNWTTNDSGGRRILYLAIGAATTTASDSIVVAHNDSTEFDLFKIDSNNIGGGAWSAVESVASTNTNLHVSFASGLAQLLYVHRKWATARRYDGTTAAAIAGAPSGRCIAFHKNRFFIGGTDANPTRLWYSDLASYTSWPVTNYIDIGKDDGEAVEDVGIFEDGLIIAKRNSLWFLSGSGPDTFTVHPLNAGGSAVGKTVCPTPYGCIVAGLRQVWLWTGGGVENVSKPVEETYDMRSADFVSTAYADGVAYILDEFTGTMFCLNMALGQWHVEKLGSASTEGPAVIVARGTRLFYGPQAGTTISLLAYRDMPGASRARDSSLGETFRVWTPEIWAGGPRNAHTPQLLTVKFKQRGGDANQTPITVTTIFGKEDGTESRTDTLTPRASAGSYRKTIPIGDNVKGKGVYYVQFRFEQTLLSSESALMDLEEIEYEFLHAGGRP